MNIDTHITSQATGVLKRAVLHLCIVDTKASSHDQLSAEYGRAMQWYASPQSSNARGPEMRSGIACKGTRPAERASMDVNTSKWEPRSIKGIFCVRLSYHYLELRTTAVRSDPRANRFIRESQV